jgi:hypothetical protein
MLILKGEKRDFARLRASLSPNFYSLAKQKNRAKSGQMPENRSTLLLTNFLILEQKKNIT